MDANNDMIFLGSTEFEYHFFNVPFDDLEYYQRLRSQKSCQKVEISSIRVYHTNDICRGLRVQYKQSFTDGSKPRKVNGPKYLFGTTPTDGDTHSTRINLEEKEHIYGFEINQGQHGIYGIAFLTNHGRRIHFGGTNGELVRVVADPPRRHRIVAFAGAGRYGRHNFVFGPESPTLLAVDCYAKKRDGWDQIRHWVMLRWLQQKGRATPVAVDFPRNKFKRIRLNGEIMMIHEFLDIPNGIFQHILGFLF